MTNPILNLDFPTLKANEWSMLTDIAFDEPDPSNAGDVVSLESARGYVGDRVPRMLADLPAMKRKDYSSLQRLHDFYEALRSEHPLDGGSPPDLAKALRGDEQATRTLFDAFEARPRQHGVPLSLFTDMKSFREGDKAAGGRALTFLDTWYKGRKTTPQFRFSHDGMTFRCKRKIRFDGSVRLTLRRIPERVPVLSQLKFANPHVPNLMQSPDFLRGGLFLVIAPIGQGKTTTITAMMKTRHLIYGGQSATIEDPVESYLDGFHGYGECVQTQVDPARPPEETFPEAFRDSMRDFATSTTGGIMMHVSEIRDPYTASACLTAAQSGYFVIATTHSDTIPDAIRRVMSMASQVVGETVARESMASCLRGVFHQRLELSMKPEGWRRGTITGNILYSKDATSTVAGILKDKDPNALGDELSRQNNLLKESLISGAKWPDLFTALGGDPGRAEIPNNLNTNVMDQYLTQMAAAEKATQDAGA